MMCCLKPGEVLADPQNHWNALELAHLETKNLRRLPVS